MVKPLRPIRQLAYTHADTRSLDLGSSDYLSSTAITLIVFSNTLLSLKHTSRRIADFLYNTNSRCSIHNRRPPESFIECLEKSPGPAIYAVGPCRSGSVAGPRDAQLRPHATRSISSHRELHGSARPRPYLNGKGGNRRGIVVVARLILRHLPHPSLDRSPTHPPSVYLTPGPSSAPRRVHADARFAAICTLA